MRWCANGELALLRDVAQHTGATVRLWDIEGATGQRPCHGTLVLHGTIDPVTGRHPAHRGDGPPRTVGLEAGLTRHGQAKGPPRTVGLDCMNRRCDTRTWPSAPDRRANCWTDGTRSYLPSHHGPLCCYGPLSLRKDRGTCPDPHPRCGSTGPGHGPAVRSRTGGPLRAAAQRPYF